MPPLVAPTVEPNSSSLHSLLLLHWKQNRDFRHGSLQCIFRALGTVESISARPHRAKSHPAVSRRASSSAGSRDWLCCAGFKPSVPLFFRVRGDAGRPEGNGFPILVLMPVPRVRRWIMRRRHRERSGRAVVPDGRLARPAGPCGSRTPTAAMYSSRYSSRLW